MYGYVCMDMCVYGCVCMNNNVCEGCVEGETVP